MSPARAALLLALPVWISAGFFTPSPQEDAWPVTGGAAPGYVPDAACADCHEDLAESYRSVGMSRSFAPMTPDVVTADFDGATFVHELSGDHYEFVRRGDEFFQRRWRVDDQGRRHSEHEQRMDWIVGSGSRVQTFLHQTPSGEMYQLPVSWYSDPDRWAMSPGYDIPEHSGFSRIVPLECMFCHNAYPDVPAGSDRVGMTRSFPTEMPHGIGCQRCHGPGAEHVALAEGTDASDEEVRSSIYGPDRIGPDWTDELCFQCHLQPLAAITDSVRVDGRPVYSHRPGEPLGDYHLVFDVVEDRPVEARFEINHHPYRLRQSRCYTASGGALSCLTCHDPHRDVPPEERAEHFRRSCLTCHGEEDCSSMGNDSAHGVDTSDCVACHMPSHRTQDVIQVKMTDHLIRRDPAPENWLAPLEEASKLTFEDLVLYWPESEQDEEELALYTATVAVHNGMSDLKRELALGLAALEPDFLDPWLTLAGAHRRAGNPKEAAKVCAEAARRFPDELGVLREWGRSLIESDRPAEAVPHLERARELAPEDPDVLFLLAEATSADRPRQTLGLLRKGLALRPNDAEARRRLGEFLLNREENELALIHLRKAVGLEVDDVEGRRLLGDVYRALGDWESAVDEWERAAEGTIDDLELEKRLAFAHLAAPKKTLRANESGYQHARRASEVDPEDAAARALHALGLLVTNAPLEAIPEALEAQRLGADPVVCEGILELSYKLLSRAKEALEARKRGRQARAQPPGVLRPRVLELLEDGRTR